MELWKKILRPGDNEKYFHPAAGPETKQFLGSASACSTGRYTTVAKCYDNSVKFDLMVLEGVQYYWQDLWEYDSRSFFIKFSSLF